MSGAEPTAPVVPLSVSYPNQDKPDPFHVSRTRTTAQPPYDITLEQMLEALVEHYGWPTLGSRIRCFNENPTIKSILTFLRKTPWARQ